MFIAEVLKMNRSSYFLLLLFFVTAIAEAQIVTIDPVFFTIEDEITVTYDASKGNRGLENVNQVFTHTGVITRSGGAGNWQFVQGTWGTNDAKVRMTNIGDNKHQLTFDIRVFYGLNNNINDVTHLAFVFRNVDGSKEGKTATNGDIFIEIPEVASYDAFLQSPTERQLVIENGGFVDIDIVASAPSTIAVYDNDVLIVEEVNTMRLTQSYQPAAKGDHVIRFEASAGDFTETGSFSFVYAPEVAIAEMPDGIAYGLNYDFENQEATIALHAPFKDHVFLINSINDFQLKSEYLLNRTPDGNNWWIRIPLKQDEELLYQFLVDGDLRIADPLSTLILDPIHDQSISNTLNLPPYPKESTDGHLSYFTYNSAQEMIPFESPEKEDLVIYEVLLRDFLGTHSFEDLQDTLSYLQSLGVNAIELMPIQEFEANDSWGYNPSYHMALDKYYGSPSDFRSFINEAHRRGIAVILDVVFNHAFGQSPLVQLYWDQQVNRPSSESPYFNATAKHPFNVGYDFNHESQATQSYVQQVLRHWIEEFHVDGFRFDLSKGFTQNFSADNEAMSKYDASRVAILKQYANYVWNIDQEQYVILEHFASNEEELELAEAGMMLWGNGNYNFNEATMGYHEDGKSDFSWQSYKERGWSSPNIIGYMESHDEERLMYKNLQFGNSNGSYNVKNVDVALQRNAMAAILFFSIPGPKMIWQFGELGYDYSINRCTNGVVDDCRLDRKPIRWDYGNQEPRVKLLEVYRKMIELKTQNPLFKTTDFVTVLDGPVKVVFLNSDQEHAVAIGNFDVQSSGVLVDFVENGMWYDVFSSDSINVTNRRYEFVLEPGEYHLFLDEKPLSTATTDLIELGASFHLFPNPTNQFLNIEIDGLENTKVTLQIFDHKGRVIKEDSMLSAERKKVNIQDVMNGYYLLKLSTSKGTSVMPFIKS